MGRVTLVLDSLWRVLPSHLSNCPRQLQTFVLQISLKVFILSLLSVVSVTPQGKANGR